MFESFHALLQDDVQFVVGSFLLVSLVMLIVAIVLIKRCEHLVEDTTEFFTAPSQLDSYLH